MNKKISTLIAALCLVGALVVPTEGLSARTKSQASEPLFTHAVQTLEAVRQHFKTDDKSLLQEAIPVQPNQNAYSYLWVTVPCSRLLAPYTRQVVTRNGSSSWTRP